MRSYKNTPVSTALRQWINGLLGIRNRHTWVDRTTRERTHPCERASVPRDLRHRARMVEGDSHLTRPVAPERTREKDRPANILPAVPHTKVLTEAPVVAESRRRKSRIHEIFAQWSHLAAFSSATTGLRESYENVARPCILYWEVICAPHIDPTHVEFSLPSSDFQTL